MATRTPEKILSYSAAVTRWEQKAASKDVEHRHTRLPPTASSLGQRCEARRDYQCMCSYEVLEVIDKRSVVIEQGKVFACNQSTEGILLVMRSAPHEKQLIEVHTPCSGLYRTMIVFEVRWSRLLQVESVGSLYLVGCRRMFGPCHYLSF
jgi:hypothetical protein